MSNLKLDLDRVLTYQQAADFLGSFRKTIWRPSPVGTSLPSMEIGHHTTLSDMGHGILEVCYHNNPIIHYTPYEIGITLAGWDTITTRDRLNKLQPVAVRKAYIFEVLGHGDRRSSKTFIGKMLAAVNRWYSFPWPPPEILDNPEALAEWGRTVEPIEA